MIDEATVELEPVIGIRAACRATGRAQASHYRRHRQSPSPVRPVRERRAQPRALSEVERDTVRALLNSPDFVDKAPATVYHELLDEGIYVASVSSMYRILRAHGGRRTPPPGRTPGPDQTRTCCHGTEPVLELGHHEAARPGEVVVLSPVCDHRHLLPVHGRLADR